MPSVRHGKTEKDRNSGATDRNHANKHERVLWQYDVMNEPRIEHRFPKHTCNGKRNRHQVTGKGNRTIVLN